MRGYPKHVNTKEDYTFLLDSPKFRSQALDELKQIVALTDSQATIAVEPIDPNKPEGDWRTETITAKLPRYKQLGFKTKTELKTLIAGATKQIGK